MGNPTSSCMLVQPMRTRVDALPCREYVFLALKWKMFSDLFCMLCIRNVVKLGGFTQTLARSVKLPHKNYNSLLV